MVDADLRIDCDTCAGRGAHCGQCVVSVFLGMPAPAALDPAERAALAALADGGLVPPLRLAAPPSAGSGRRSGASEIAARRAVS